ncbi:multiple sugar transport system substrate-binding protein/raffinose/stachyose/melibiose transport system substrate-binding protein [Hamadaea flava]|uniref:ABC transporter substrate-binding protein n=1 Tax=Hamadaea flava TaxID=1742688 RepID=A0ABV8LI18_9ACTN|nr:extracellular solute-binding protein [Hamadaea flava]MCP2324221.1 multiple sugar transport system substrate-binding protein/raffinose/stachyose/melibiose transport system substrate-binding protein [Hamadaea flava]
MRRLWRRACTAAVAATVVMAAATGCSSDSDDASGQTTLRVIVNITPNLTEQYWNTLFDGYEKTHPGVTVKLELTGTISAAAKLTQDLAAGDPPDIAQQITPTKENASLFADLSDQDWVKDTPLVDQYAIDGKRYLVGVGVQIQSLVFYSKAAFAKAGLTATDIKTLDQFSDAMGKLKAAGYAPLQTAGQWVPGGQFTLVADSGVLTADADWYAKRKAGSVSFAGSDYEKYLSRYKNWISQGYLEKSALGLTYADGQTNFLNGKSAMYVMGSFFVPAADTAKKSDDIGVFTMPTDGAYPSGQVGNIANPYVVANASKHKAEAIEFVKWLTTDPTAIESQLAADGNLRKGFTYKMSSLGTAVQQILDGSPSVLVKAGERQPISGYSGELNTQVQSLFSNASAQQVAAGLDKWWNSQK